LIVVDASAAVELLLATRLGVKLADRLLGDDETLHAPELLDLEVAQVLRRYERARALSAARAELALRDLADLRLERYPHRLLLPRAWEIRKNVSLYDGAYVALAELLDCPLVTCDGSLRRAPTGVDVELFR
jgi:predicted nucleic acid-binding protein